MALYVVLEPEFCRVDRLSGEGSERGNAFSDCWRCSGVAVPNATVLHGDSQENVSFELSTAVSGVVPSGAIMGGGWYLVVAFPRSSQRSRGVWLGVAFVHTY